MQRLLRTLRWCLAGLACAMAPAWASPVCVVSSSKVAAFQETSDVLTQELTRNGVTRQDIQAVNGADSAEGSACLQDARVIVSLGTEALRQVLARNPKAAVFAGLIPRASFEQVVTEAGKKGAANVAALYLDQPLARQLDLLRLALPKARRVGVVWGPESVTQQGSMSAAMQQRGMEPVEGSLNEGSQLINALQAALQDADVLLAVADGAVYNSTTVSNILLTSYRAKTPVVAFSPAYVKAGALMAVHTTPAQAALQLAGMAAHYLQTGVLGGSQYPTDFSVSTNDYVARSLGLSLEAKPLTERLHKLEKRP
jgi:putative tryptophan/tyrosine transport system substrate-binding protein